MKKHFVHICVIFWNFGGGVHVTDKELRRLKRRELIEILYYLSRENDELKEKNQKLEMRIDALIKLENSDITDNDENFVQQEKTYDK